MMSKSIKTFAAGLAVVAVFLFSVGNVSQVFAGGLTGKKIALDAGHGGTDPGAVGPTGLKEANVNLAVVQKLDSYLKGQGASTKLTRESDVFVGLTARTDIANNWGADRFIAVHFNASSDRSVNGTETLYYTYGSATSKDLASKLQNRLVEALGLPNRGIKQRDDLTVLIKTKMPAALTESSFISNTYEEARLKDSSYLDKIARAHYLGIMDHFGVSAETPSQPPSTPPSSSGGSLAGKTIIVDPAAGGSSSGGIGPTGLKGKDVNLRVATVLKNCLVEYGKASVVMTRDSDVSMTIASRVEKINSTKADKLVSIQFPKSTNPETNYTKTYYYKYASTSADSLKLAQGIQKRLVEALRLTDKGVGSSSSSILKDTSKIPGALVKPSHLSNPYEEARLKDAGYTWKIGKAIYDGVADSYK